MTEVTTPFEDHDDDLLDDDQEGEGPSEAVAELLELAAERGLDLADFIELALLSVHTVIVELEEQLMEGREFDTHEMSTLIASERLQIASEILAGVDFGDGPEEGEGEGEEGEDLAQAA